MKLLTLKKTIQNILILSAPAFLFLVLFPIVYKIIEYGGRFLDWYWFRFLHL